MKGTLSFTIGKNMDFYYSENDGLTIFNGIRDREDIRRAIGIGYSVLPQTEFSENSVDAFGNAVARCWYDASNKCIEIEIYDISAKFYLHNQQLIGISYSEIKDILKNKNIDYCFDEEGLGINIFGDTIRFYISKIDEYGESSKVEAVWIRIP